MSDERAAARREVIAELLELARRQGAGHFDLYEAAAAAGKDDMRIRAEYGVSAWNEVERVLRTM